MQNQTPAFASGRHFLTSLVRHALEHPENHRWTLQGFGMLRAYFPGDIRLAIWDSRYMFDPKPSMIHDHPWDFTSIVVAGEIWNQKYTIVPRYRPTHWMRTIKPGEGTKPLSEDELVHLWPQPMETIPAGRAYHQQWDEIHETSYADGTVTLVARDRGKRPDAAKVFWRAEETWQTAESREATPEEIREITQSALRRL